MTATIVTNATIVTVDQADLVVTNGTLVALDGAITYVGPSADAPAVPPEATVIDARGAIVLPGFVNAHTHLAMTLFRGYADDMDLDGFLAKLLPVEGRVLSDTTVELGTRLASVELLRSGTTTALDMYFFTDAAQRAAMATGLRLYNGPVFIEFPGPDGRPFPERMAWARNELEQGARWVQPHSTYLLDEAQLRSIGDLAHEFGAGINVHSSETSAEIAQVFARHGRTPTEVLADCGLLGPRTICAHGVHLSGADIERIAGSGASVAHCPASNMKLSSGIARVGELQRAGVNVALGTDGAASANDLDLWMAMRLAAFVQHLPARAAVRMATIDGARALGIDHLVGSLEVGKRADLVILDADAPSLTPSFNPLSSIAYAGSRAEVDTVVVDGQVVVRGRRMVDIDVPALLAEVRAFAIELS